jgi:hypothetical protein
MSLDPVGRPSIANPNRGEIRLSAALAEKIPSVPLMAAKTTQIRDSMLHREAVEKLWAVQTGDNSLLKFWHFLVFSISADSVSEKAVDSSEMCFNRFARDCSTSLLFVPCSILKTIKFQNLSSPLPFAAHYPAVF